MKLSFSYLFTFILLFSTVINAKCIAHKHKKIIKKIHKKQIHYRFADADEAATLLLSNRNYYDHLNQMDLDYRLKKNNGTLEELEEFTKKQTLNFTEEDKKVVDTIINQINNICKDRGYTLPQTDTIVFAKTTGQEEMDSDAYTHGNQIYLSENILMMGQEGEDFVPFVLAHEIFHCLTRNNPDFRRDIYNIIGFTIVDKDFDFPKEISDHIISNPDVEHHNSYASFEINGEMKNCVVVFTTFQPFDKEEIRFLNNMNISLVPIDDLYTIYNSDEASNFFDVLGRNYISYMIDPEEVMANNFALTIINGLNEFYETPYIIESIDAYLKSYKLKK